MNSTPPWAQTPTGTGFSAPRASTTPATSAGLLGRHIVRAAQEAQRSRSARMVSVFLVALIVALIAAAGGLAWRALVPEDMSAPVPAAGFEVAPGEPVGATGKALVDLQEGSPGERRRMTVADMGKNSMFIPSLGVYMPLEQDSTFVSSHYAGFDTLRVPSNPWHGVRYSSGAPLYGGDAGTTLVASHVSNRTGWGALRHLYTLRGGELIYTKDADGQVQTWQLTRMRIENHTDFPQEYWSSEGERQLVVTTCGGTLRAGNYDKNIFAIATPIDPAPVVSVAGSTPQPPVGG